VTVPSRKLQRLQRLDPRALVQPGEPNRFADLRRLPSEPTPRDRPGGHHPAESP